MKNMKKILLLLLLCMCLNAVALPVSASPYFLNSSVCVTRGLTRNMILHDAEDGTIKWKSSNKKIATVNSKGVVSGKNLGSCTISAKYNGKTYKCKVKVCSAPYKREWMPAYYEEISPVKENKGCILIAGTSFIERWHAKKAFQPYPVVTIGIGSTKVNDWAKWKERLLYSYEPQALVLYVGGNDIDGGASADQTAQRYKAFLDDVSQELSEIPIYVLEIAPSPARKKKQAQMNKYNHLIADYCSHKSNITYIDYSSHLMKNGKVSKKYFDRYGFHFCSKGYSVWNSVVAGAIKKDLAELQ